MIIDKVAFKGRCDRLELLMDGSYVIFDYKSGKADRYAQKPPAGRLQPCTEGGAGQGGGHFLPRPGGRPFGGGKG